MVAVNPVISAPQSALTELAQVPEQILLWQSQVDWCEVEQVKPVKPVLCNAAAGLPTAHKFTD